MIWCFNYFIACWKSFRLVGGS